MVTVREVPRTKLWGDFEQGFVIVLECSCGAALHYPGHPDDVREVECEKCRTIWKVVP